MVEQLKGTACLHCGGSFSNQRTSSSAGLTVKKTYLASDLDGLLSGITCVARASSRCMSDDAPVLIILLTKSANANEKFTTMSASSKRGCLCVKYL